MHVCFQKNREFWAIMSAFTWKELALADAVATKDLIDKEGVHSHKVLELTFRQKSQSYFGQTSEKRVLRHTEALQNIDC